MTIRHCILICFCTASLWTSAQSQDSNINTVFETAEYDYSIGRFEEADSLLTRHLTRFSGNIKQSVYRLLALTSIATEKPEKAEEYVRLLLNINPYYTPTPDDQRRFIDMVERIKAGMSATITTASSQAENLNEVPVPTTLITEEMIKDSGARNLQEVLAAFVPGMTFVDCNDDINIAMRGIYSNGQEKILIMLNGHRLNSYATNIAAPDFSISLDKLKQIEVLRGPASSLYGGVSLTAVVNLITKQGADVDGVEARLGIGNYGQLRGNLLFGKRYFDLDMLVWGGFYKASGEKVYMPYEDTALGLNDGDITIGGVGKKPSFDVGLAMKYKNLQFLYDTHFSQVISPMTMTYLFAPYDIEKYRTHNGLAPGFATQSHHAELTYGQQLGNFYIKGAATYDNSDLTHYQVLSEAQVSALADALPVPDKVKEAVKGYGGISRYINGQEHTFGAKFQGDWSYVEAKEHKGLLSFGTEVNYFELEDVRYTFGYDHTLSVSETDVIPQLGKGHESNVNFYGQLKHQWRSFILNAGLRFDYKNRYNDTKIREFSPRLALIYVQPKWNLKLSYSKAFIDAPYLYRKTNLFLAEMMGYTSLVEDLQPESLHSFQMTFGAVQWAKGLDFEVNGFYNRARDLIYMELFEHYNTGNIDTYGLEFSGKYRTSRFSANLVVEWQRESKTEIFDRERGSAFNTPEISVSSVLAWRPVKNLKLHTHLLFYGTQTAYYLDIRNYSAYLTISKHVNSLRETYATNPTPELLQQIKELAGQLEVVAQNVQINKDISSRLVWNIGANYQLGRAELGLNVHNLLNKQYYQSGMSTTLIPQQGRWFMFDVSYKF